MALNLFLGWVLNTGTYLYSFPIKQVTKNSFELRTGRKPYLSHSWLWGCQVEVKVYNLQAIKLPQNWLVTL